MEAAVTEDRETIADITGRLEARILARLVDDIRPLLAGRSAEMQRAVLAALAAEWAARQTTRGENMVGSDHDFNWTSGFIQVRDCTAIKELELIVGSDRIFRVNIDGVCSLRVRLHGDAELVIRDFRKLLEPDHRNSE